MKHSKDAAGEPAPSKYRPTVLEWLGLSVSIISMLVALLSAYVTYYYTKDDLRVLFHQYSVTTADAEPGKVGLASGTTDFVLMNLGTRNAAIMAVEGRMGEPTNCHPIASDIYLSFLNFDPKVLEPGKLMNLSLKAAGGFYAYGRIGNQAKEKDGVMYIPEGIFYPGLSELEVCVSFRIVTPTIAETVALKIGTMKIRSTGPRPSNLFEVVEQTTTGKQTPLLLHQSRWPF